VKRGLRVHPYLALVAGAALALTAATAFWLETMPKRLDENDPDWLAVGASWATVFFAQIGAFLALVCPVAAHALSGRWSWSVRLFTFVSLYFALSMAMLAVNAYQDADKASGHVKTPARFLEDALTFVAVLLFYFLFTLCTLVWIATRGRRYWRGSRPVTPTEAPLGA
jgi:4-hydroxybenzoate polyprenyltransferase